MIKKHLIELFCASNTQLCVSVCVSGWDRVALLFSVHHALVGCNGTKHLQTGDQKTTASTGRRPRASSPRQITHAEVRTITNARMLVSGFHRDVVLFSGYDTCRVNLNKLAAWCLTLV